MGNREKKMLLFGVGTGVVFLALVVILIVLLAQGCSRSQTSGKLDQSDSTVLASSDTDSLPESSESTLSGNGTVTDTQSGTSGNGNTQVASSGGQGASAGSTISSKSESTGNTTSTKGETVVEQKIDTSKYNLYTYTRRYWEGDTVYNESVYPMTTQSGENETVQVLYPATQILEVRSSDLKTVYQEGRDYQLANGKLVIPKGSHI